MPYLVVTTDSWGPDGGWFDHRCALTFQSKASYEHHESDPMPYTKLSTRGRHDPGDGPITTRFASGGEVYCKYSNQKAYTAFDKYDEYLTNTNDTAYRRIYWGHGTYVELLARDRGYNGYPEFSCTAHFWGHAYTWDHYPGMCRIWRRDCTYGNRGSGTGYRNGKDAYNDGLQWFNMWMTQDYWDRPDLSYTYYGCYYYSSYIKVIVKPRLSNLPFYGAEEMKELSLATHRWETGLAAAFTDAVSKLPNLDGMNNIANISDIVSFIGSLRSGVSSVGSLADAWLGYRYVYSTTKADITELVSYADRIASLPDKLQSNGIYRDGDFTFRCALHVDIPQVKSMRSFAERWGLSLSGYNLWDMIPYSFIVDWFTGIGDKLAQWEEQEYSMRISQACWCSVQHTFTNEFGFPEKDYSRFVYSPKSLLGPVSKTAHGAKASTIVKRGLDVLALFG